MTITLVTYEQAFAWISNTGAKARPHLLLGNGFSVAYDQDRFSYRALRDHAQAQGSIGSLAEKFFSTLGTYDFEIVIRQLVDAANALSILDATKHSAEIRMLQAEADSLKEALAQTLASLHPNRPSDLTDDAYARVREFVNRHGRVFTANYDLLLYWAVMQDAAPESQDFRPTDDGFRSPEHDADYVVWNHLNPQSQTIYYLHGALHVYRDAQSAELQKLTWKRTGDALIDQIRLQLSANRFPLIVAEGTSTDKLGKIQTSDYLSRGLRSLAAVGGGTMSFGLSFSANDAHIVSAIVQSKVKRLAVSIYGDVGSAQNHATIQAVNRLVADRLSFNSRIPLEVEFYDAITVPLWS